MTQYLLSVWMTEGVEPYATDEEMQQVFADVDKFNQEIQASGHWVFAGGLHPADTATVVRADKGAGGEVSTWSPPTARSPRPRSRSAGSGSSRPRISTRPSPSPPGARPPARAPVEVRPFQDE